MEELRPIEEVVRLVGKTAIVTGGAMGIGYGIAYRIAEAGANVVIADMNKAAADESAAKLVAKGWKATAVSANVSDAAQIDAMIRAAVGMYGSLDILVNNAGIYPAMPVMQMDEEKFEKVMHVNLKGVFLATKAAAAQMIAQGKGGRIINITSVDALHPSMVGLAAYDATKHGVWGFTKSAALELAPHKIWVNAIAPGGVRTPGTGAGHVAKDLEAVMKPFIERIPMKRAAEPDEIGKVALFLASDMASYMTGSQVVVDGGVLLS
jgi:2-deoxy-D-gluconate 3-dehydrogenase